MITLAIANQKGGVGKTTTALNLGACLAADGRRVVLVDLDPQGSLTQALAPRYDGPSMADVMGGAQPGRMPIQTILQPIDDRLYLAPSELALSVTELNLTARMGREVVLRKALDGLSYDVCIVDCGPSLGLLVVNALAACAGVICPTLPTAVDLKGLRLFLQSLTTIKAELNPALELIGVLVTQFDKRLTLHREALDTLQAAGLPILGIIGKSIEAARSVGAGEPILTGNLAEQYKQFAEVIDQWLRNQQA